MGLLLRLPLMLIELLLRRVIGRFAGTDDDPVVSMPPTGPAPAEPVPAAPTPPPPPPPTPEPPRHVDRDAEVVASVGPAEDVHATIQVDEPWDGYDEMAATAIVERLRDADAATKGVVRLYEQGRKGRATVIRATD